MSDRQMLKHAEIAAMVAYKFHKRNPDIEFEVLEQEALEAVWRAQDGDRYDPCKAGFATFATTCATRQLLTLAQTHRRRYLPTDSLDAVETGMLDARGWLIDDRQPSPEHSAIFAELIRQLPDDAKTVVQLILGDASAFGGLASRRAKKLIADALGWPAERLLSAFSDIAYGLGRRGVTRRASVAA